MSKVELMSKKILVVEDLAFYQKLVQNAIGIKYDVEVVETLRSAREKLSQFVYDLIVLDVGLPDGSGFDFCREIQQTAQHSDVPIVFLTARESVSDKILGFTLGADDYVTKPFDGVELLARIDSKIAKYAKLKSQSHHFKKGPVRFDLNLQCVFLGDEQNETKIGVTPTEYKLFLKLAQNSHKAVTRKELKDLIWTEGSDVDERNVDKHISSLRKKLGIHDKCICSSSGVGYMFKG